MGVRVRLRVKSRLTGREIVTSALVNSGFEADRPQLMIPMRLATELGLWPPPRSAVSLDYGTAGGDVTFVVVPDALIVQVLTEDRRSKEVTCDAVISATEPEVLINDYLQEELEIEVIKARSGLWRFSDDPPGKLRRSELPQYWR